MEVTSQPAAGLFDASGSLPRLSVILGTNEVASAIAAYFRHFGRAVVLSHDPLAPVIRRGMAFDDALFSDFQRVETISAKRIDTLSGLIETLACERHVAITYLGLNDLLVIGSVDVIVDARMHKRAIVPDFRGLARVTIGVGPGFVARGNCDVAVETKPGCEGLVISAGGTAPPDGIPRILGGAGIERFVYTQAQGMWHTALEIGTKVFKNIVLGHLDGEPVYAPIDGRLRGIARDGIEMPAGVKLVEIDPRGRAARWAGIDEPARRIAESVLWVSLLHGAETAVHSPRRATSMKG